MESLTNEVVVNVNTPNIEFISTRSSLGLDITDLSASVDGDPNHQLDMPFEAYYAPLEANQYHASLPIETASWLLDQALSLHQGGELILNGPGERFNFGKNTNNIIFNSYSVQNGATLGVNLFGRSDYNNKFPLAPSTLSGSHFSASTGMQEGVTISVQNGGNLVLGHTFGRTATLTIRAGSTLVLDPNSTLRIHEGSTLIIEPGATFRVEQGANIQLMGDDAVLQIEGNFVLGSGATFTFTGTGFVRLGLPNQPGGQYHNVILDGPGPHGISLVGSGPHDKVLEIMPFTYLGPDYDLDHFMIQSARVELGEDARIDGCEGRICSKVILRAFAQRDVSFACYCSFRGSHAALDRHGLTLSRITIFFVIPGEEFYLPCQGFFWFSDKNGGKLVL